MPNLVGAIHIWVDALPCLQQLFKCEHCRALLLGPDRDEHAAYHRRRGDV